ncbi:hypothetical protein IPA_04950 [Ignicoccus pacificus DSM 13166]|uniref:Uncharacterized protein n=1 Tax=Ignicoccus pacificus DSM 13166 TaxID=940294 RepID=A0A977KC74_9CREN|nr:hypothetical protein IPA_04950 [Ignicoccus pacificus DSM 13166]
MAKRKRSTKKSSKSTRTKRRKSGVRRRTWDPVHVAEKLAPSVYSMLGLDVLGLSDDQVIELLRDLLVQLMGDRVTKPKAETLVNNILRNQKRIFAVLAAKLLEIVPEGELTPEQLEFVVSYIGELSIPFVPRLYREMKRLGIDLSGPLQASWEEAWRFRGEPGPVGYCPRCGFRAVDPTGTCMVCGYMLNEKELRKAVDFEDKFKEFLSTATCEDLRKALSEGRLFVDHSSASLSPNTKWAIEIFLNSKDRNMLKSIIEEKCNKPKKKLEDVLDEILEKIS